MKNFLKETTQGILAGLALFFAIGIGTLFYIDTIIDVYDTTVLKFVFLALVIVFSFAAWNTEKKK